MSSSTPRLNQTAPAGRTASPHSPHTPKPPRPATGVSHTPTRPATAGSATSRYTRFSSSTNSKFASTSPAGMTPSEFRNIQKKGQKQLETLQRDISGLPREEQIRSVRTFLKTPQAKTQPKPVTDRLLESSWNNRWGANDDFGRPLINAHSPIRRRGRSAGGGKPSSPTEPKIPAPPSPKQHRRALSVDSGRMRAFGELSLNKQNFGPIVEEDVEDSEALDGDYLLELGCDWFPNVDDMDPNYIVIVQQLMKEIEHIPKSVPVTDNEAAPTLKLLDPAPAFDAYMLSIVKEMKLFIATHYDVLTSPNSSNTKNSASDDKKISKIVRFFNQLDSAVANSQLKEPTTSKQVTTNHINTNNNQNNESTSSSTHSGNSDDGHKVAEEDDEDPTTDLSVGLAYEKRTMTESMVRKLKHLYLLILSATATSGVIPGSGSMKELQRQQYEKWVAAFRSNVTKMHANLTCSEEVKQQKTDAFVNEYVSQLQVSNKSPWVKHAFKICSDPHDLIFEHFPVVFFYTVDPKACECAMIPPCDDLRAKESEAEKRAKGKLKAAEDELVDAANKMEEAKEAIENVNAPQAGRSHTKLSGVQKRKRAAEDALKKATSRHEELQKTVASLKAGGGVKKHQRRPNPITQAFNPIIGYNPSPWAVMNWVLRVAKEGTTDDIRNKSQKVVELFSYFRDALDLALRTFPCEPRCTFRGVGFPVSHNYELGTEFTWPSFSSTSTVGEASLAFMNEKRPGTFFVIKIFRVAMIHFASWYPEQLEALLRQSTHLTVRIKVPGSVTRLIGWEADIVVLEQVPSDTDLQFYAPINTSDRIVSLQQSIRPLSFLFDKFMERYVDAPTSNRFEAGSNSGETSQHSQRFVKMLITWLSNTNFSSQNVPAKSGVVGSADEDADDDETQELTNAKHLVILGPAGSGKTSAAVASWSWIGLHKQEEQIIPIFVWLPKVSGLTSVAGGLDEYVAKTVGLNAEDFKVLIETKHVILILDSLDEVAGVTRTFLAERKLFALNPIIADAQNATKLRCVLTFRDDLLISRGFAEKNTSISPSTILCDPNATSEEHGVEAPTSATKTAVLHMQMFSFAEAMLYIEKYCKAEKHPEATLDIQKVAARASSIIRRTPLALAIFTETELEKWIVANARRVDGDDEHKESSGSIKTTMSDVIERGTKQHIQRALETDAATASTSSSDPPPSPTDQSLRESAKVAKQQWKSIFDSLGRVARTMFNEGKWLLDATIVDRALRKIDDGDTVDHPVHLQHLPSRSDNLKDPEAQFAFRHKRYAEFFLAFYLWNNLELRLPELSEYFGLQNSVLLEHFRELSRRDPAKMAHLTDSVLIPLLVDTTAADVLRSNALALAAAARCVIRGVKLRGGFKQVDLDGLTLIDCDFSGGGEQGDDGTSQKHQDPMFLGGSTTGCAFWRGHQKVTAMNDNDVPNDQQGNASNERSKEDNFPENVRVISRTWVGDGRQVLLVNGAEDMKRSGSRSQSQSPSNSDDEGASTKQRKNDCFMLYIQQPISAKNDAPSNKWSSYLLPMRVASHDLASYEQIVPISNPDGKSIGSHFLAISRPAASQGTARPLVTVVNVACSTEDNVSTASVALLNCYHQNNPQQGIESDDVLCGRRFMAYSPTLSTKVDKNEESSTINTVGRVVLQDPEGSSAVLIEVIAATVESVNGAAKQKERSKKRKSSKLQTVIGGVRVLAYTSAQVRQFGELTTASFSKNAQHLVWGNSRCHSVVEACAKLTFQAKRRQAAVEFTPTESRPRPKTDVVELFQMYNFPVSTEPNAANGLKLSDDGKVVYWWRGDVLFQRHTCSSAIRRRAVSTIADGSYTTILGVELYSGADGNQQSLVAVLASRFDASNTDTPSNRGILLMNCAGLTLREHAALLESCCEFLPHNGSKLSLWASSHQSPTGTIRTVNTKKLLAEQENSDQREGHTGEITVISSSPSASAPLVLTGGHDGTLCSWTSPFLCPVDRELLPGRYEVTAAHTTDYPLPIMVVACHARLIVLQLTPERDFEQELLPTSPAKKNITDDKKSASPTTGVFNHIEMPATDIHTSSVRCISSALVLSSSGLEKHEESKREKEKKEAVTVTDCNLFVASGDESGMIALWKIVDHDTTDDVLAKKMQSASVGPQDEDSHSYQLRFPRGAPERLNHVRRQKIYLSHSLDSGDALRGVCSLAFVHENQNQAATSVDDLLLVVGHGNGTVSTFTVHQVKSGLSSGTEFLTSAQKFTHRSLFDVSLIHIAFTIPNNSSQPGMIALGGRSNPMLLLAPLVESSTKHCRALPDANSHKLVDTKGVDDIAAISFVDTDRLVIISTSMQIAVWSSKKDIYLEELDRLEASDMSEEPKKTPENESRKSCASWVKQRFLICEACGMANLRRGVMLKSTKLPSPTIPKTLPST